MKDSYRDKLSRDVPASLAVFFVAIPLCLGIAHASGAPLLSGLVSGVLGGIVVGSISRSPLSVSGPAAGLTAVVLSALSTLGSFDAVLTATFVAGLLQLAFGAARAGFVSKYIPLSVIKGMLSAIGIILIFKQLPHMVGYDIEEFGVDEFLLTKEDLNEKYADEADPEWNTFTLLIHALKHTNTGILLIGLLSLFLLIGWEKTLGKRWKALPGALIVVIAGLVINWLYDMTGWFAHLTGDHLVQVPVVKSWDQFVSGHSFMSLSAFAEPAMYGIAFTIAAVASIETLLSLEAIDKLDPEGRRSPANRELVAQGAGNTLAGLFGGLPMTSVIVRSSVNLNAGAKSRLSTILHGALILISVLFLTSFLNHIPLACLAAILVHTGYKLIRPSLIRAIVAKGWKQWLPFVVTILAILFTDLMLGVAIGLVTATFFILWEYQTSPAMRIVDFGHRRRIILLEGISFLHKPQFVRQLECIPPGVVIEIDGSRCQHLDSDIRAYLEDFQVQCEKNNTQLIIGGIADMDHNREAVERQLNALYERIFVNNRRWVEEKKQANPQYFEDLSKGQAPQYLFIGCSDSRVPANEITGTEPGEMFVHRNIANMVVNTDINMLSVVQYSVEVLNVKHVIVCGHYGCGGVKAAIDHQYHGLIDKWLRNIKDVYRLHRDELDAIKDEEQRHRRLVELNVREQVLNLMKTSFIQRNRQLYGFPQVHGWVYDLREGLLKDLQLDIDETYLDYEEIYKINY